MFKKVQMSFVFVSILLVSVVTAQETKDNAVSLESERIEQSLMKIDDAVRDMQEKNERLLDTLQQKTDIEIEKIHTEAYRETKDLLEQVYDAKKDMLESRENLILSSQNSFDKMIGIFTIAMTVFGFTLAILIALGGILLKSGYLDRNESKKQIDKAKADLKVIEELRKKAEKEEQEKSKYTNSSFESVSMEDNKVLTEEQKEVLRESARAREMADFFGVESESKESLHAYALELFYKEKYEEALDVLKKITKEHPNYLRAWNSMGRNFYDLNRYEEAMNAFDRAIEIDDKFTSAWNSKGIVHMIQKEYKKATKAFDMVIDIDKDNVASAWYNKACALALMGKKKDALDCLKGAILLDLKYKETVSKDGYFKYFSDDPEFIKLTSP